MLLLTLVVLLFDNSAATAENAITKCPREWFNWTNYCYYFSTNYSSLGKAEVACNDLSAHLVSIHSLPEQTFLVRSREVESYKHWIGQRRNTTVELILASRRVDWHWLDGTRYEFYHWIDTQPSNNALCAVIAKQTGNWETGYCHECHKFICKKGVSENPTETSSAETTQSSDAIATPELRGYTSSSLKPTRRRPTENKNSGHGGKQETIARRMNNTSENIGQNIADASTTIVDRTKPPGVYLGIAAGCVVVTVAMVVSAVIIYKRTKSKQEKTPVFIERHVKSDDGDYPKVNDYELDTDDTCGAAEMTRRFIDKSQYPRYESIHVEDLATARGRKQPTREASPPTATGETDQQQVRRVSPTRSVDKDTAVSLDSEQVAESTPEKKIMQEQDDACGGATSGETMNDDMIIVENDVYQSLDGYTQ